MKAVRYRSYGDSGVLVYEDADRPLAGAGRQAGVRCARDAAVAGLRRGRRRR